MLGFSRRHRTTAPTHHTHHTTTTTTRRRGGLFHRRNPERRAAGLKGALANPNTTHDGRKRAKHELHAMGRSAHVPLSVKVKRALGIRSTPRRQRVHRHAY
ncbi:hypothetical protein M408DRAFT_326680 [Serendipita vermifera MAFF 305830]|uniref:Uncharacterized protein n=1 Tax=Serendipita vermifera MAFF 305830 TaxID=933852 RepID=A0A0C2XVV3_SERVB|nr:hypothetical protein M408DRAFT_326680 [Serendipita vermifera MAFF 305830]